MYNILYQNSEFYIRLTFFWTHEKKIVQFQALTCMTEYIFYFYTQQNQKKPQQQRQPEK